MATVRIGLLVVALAYINASQEIEDNLPSQITPIIQDFINTNYYKCTSILVHPKTLYRNTKGSDEESQIANSFYNYSIQNQNSVIYIQFQPDSADLESLFQSFTLKQNPCYIFVLVGGLEWSRSFLESVYKSVPTLTSHDAVLITSEKPQNKLLSEKVRVGLILRYYNYVVRKMLVKTNQLNAAKTFPTFPAKPMKIQRTKTLIFYKFSYGRILTRWLIQNKENIPSYDNWKAIPTPNYEGQLIKIAALDYYPFFYYEGSKGTAKGADLKIITTIVEKLGMKYQLTAPEDEQWGSPKGNGSWTGMIGMLMNNEAQVALSCISVTFEREGVVDFSEMYYEDGLGFFSPIPQYLPQWTALVKPFPYNLWLLIIVSLFVVSFLLYIISILCRYLYSEKVSLDNFSKCIIFCLKQICAECAYKLPVHDAPRVMAGTWMLSTMVILYCYSGILTSALINPLREKPILTFGDLFSHSDDGSLEWGKVDYGGFEEHSMKTSELPEVQNIWNKMKFFDDTVVCLNQSTTSYFVCLESYNLLDSMIGEINSRPGGPYVLLSRQKLYPSMIGFPVRSGSVYKDHINTYIRKMKESGIIEKWFRDIIKFVPPASESFRGTVLTLNHLTGAFYFILCGIGLAILEFSGEMFFFKLKLPRKKDQETQG